MKCLIVKTLMVWVASGEPHYEVVTLQDCIHKSEYLSVVKHATKDITYDITDYQNDTIILKEIKKCL